MNGSDTSRYDLKTSELRKLSQTIFRDYETNSGPFSEYELPEYSAIYEIPSERERANFITLVITININVETSGKNGLWQSALEAYESERYSWIFNVEKVAEKRQLELYTEAFKPLGWRDKKAYTFWAANATTIANQFDGDVRNLLDHCSNDALSVQSYIRDEKPDWFPSLKGDKIHRLWLRLIDEEIRPLNSIEEIAIPADRNILRVTDYLRSEDLADRTPENLETVREIWNEVCAGTDLVPVHLDKPLWLCGKGSRFDNLDYWGKWGREYLTKKIESL